jgi:hypothetical protein
MSSSAAIVAALAIGVICGLVPLIYGLRKGQTGLAWGGFAACIVAGFLLGIILALPVAAVFTWLIWRGARSASGTPAPYAGEPVATPEDRPVTSGDAGDPRFDREPARDTAREPTV